MTNRELQFFYVRDFVFESGQLSPKGGKTFCVRVPSGVQLFDCLSKQCENPNIQIAVDVGEATCHDNDPFIKKMGREIALSRLTSEVFSITSVAYEGDKVQMYLASEKYSVVLSTLITKKDIVATRLIHLYINA